MIFFRNYKKHFTSIFFLLSPSLHGSIYDLLPFFTSSWPQEQDATLLILDNIDQLKDIWREHCSTSIYRDIAPILALSEPLPENTEKKSTAPTPTSLITIEHNNLAVLAFNSDNPHSISCENYVLFLNQDTQTTNLRLFHPSRVQSITLSNDERTTLTTAEDNIVRLWDNHKELCIDNYKSEKPTLNSKWNNDETTITIYTENLTKIKWQPAWCIEKMIAGFPVTLGGYLLIRLIETYANIIKQKDLESKISFTTMSKWLTEYDVSVSELVTHFTELPKPIRMLLSKKFHIFIPNQYMRAKARKPDAAVNVDHPMLP